jgi:hypothetical protein
MVNHVTEMKYTLTLTARANSREINMNKLQQLWYTRRCAVQNADTDGKIKPEFLLVTF